MPVFCRVPEKSESMQTKLFFFRSLKSLLLASFFATLSSGYAAIPFYEPFADASASGGTSYVTGNTLKGSVNATGDTWFGTGVTTTGTKAVISGNNLSYPGLPASSGGAFQTAAASGEGGRMFVSSQTSGNVIGITNQNVTLYYSTIVQLTDISALSTTGDYWIGYNNQGTVGGQNSQPGIQAARLYFKKNDATSFYVGVGKNGTNTAWDTTLRTTSDILFIVVGYQMNAAGGAGTDDNVYLWINPDASTFGQSVAPGSPNAQVIGTDPDITFVSSFVILNRTANCATAATIDEVRVGKTWKFVTGGIEFASTPPALTNLVSQSPLTLAAPARSGSGAALSYQWKKNGVNLADDANISGSTTSNLTFVAVSANDTGTYTIVATDAGGSISNATVVNVSRPGAIFWRGGNVANATAWDHSTTNWFNPTTSALDIFHDGDSIMFDDTAVTNLVNVIGTNTPFTMTTSNNVVAITLAGSGVVAGAIDVEGTGSVTLALSNAPSFTAITNNSGSLVFALGAATNTISTPIVDNGAGQGSIVQNGQSTLVLNANNSGYNGRFVVQSGTLKAGVATALGTSLSSITVSNGGTLDIGGFNLSNNPVVIQGTGASGTNGAVNNSSGTTAQQALSMVTFAGDTTFNASGGRWDIGTNANSGGYIHGNGYTLTKSGSQAVILKDVGETGIGDIHVVGGRLGFQGNVTVGDPSKTMTLESGTILTFFSAQNNPNKKLVLNSATIDSGGSNNGFYGPITVNGTCVIGVRSAFDVIGNVSGSGSLVATVNGPVGNGAAGTPVRLHGVNTFTGFTLIRTNTGMILDAQSALISPLIQMDIGASLDTTAISDWTIRNGQTLAGSGTLTASSVVFSNGSVLAPGPSNAIGTLTFSGNATFRPGSTVVFKVDPGSANDQISGLTSVTFGGTLVLSNLTGGSFAAGNTLQLFSASSYNGSFASIVPARPGPGLAWDISNLLVNGSVAVVSAPQITSGSKLPDGNFQLTFSAPVGKQYTLLASTNVALSLTNWTPLASGTIDSDPFTVSDLGATNFPKRFYTIGISQ
jgi:autotransporter-associated beta strand protein